MNENSKDLSRVLEAVLFVSGESVAVKRLAELFGLKEEEILSSIESLKNNLAERGSGLDVVLWNGRVGLVSKPEFGEVINKLLKAELDSELTPASLETLSIIAYLGPLSRSEIDFIRGVNSSFILRSLSIRGLIERTSDSSVTRGPLYAVTADFLNHIGLTDVGNLPEYEKYREVLKSFRDKSETNKES